MRIAAAAFLLACVAVAPLASARPAAAEDATPPTAPAPKLPAWKKGEQEGTVKIDGQDEKFTALVPDGYSPKKPVATMLLLHGNGGKAADFLRTMKAFVGKAPLLLIALERCD